MAPAVPAAAASAQAYAASDPLRKPPCTGDQIANGRHLLRGSAPEAAPISVGQEVTAETVVCIIEAMKVMNEIKAEVSGVVRGCAENGKRSSSGRFSFGSNKGTGARSRPKIRSIVR